MNTVLSCIPENEARSGVLNLLTAHCSAAPTSHPGCVSKQKNDRSREVGQLLPVPKEEDLEHIVGVTKVVQLMNNIELVLDAQSIIHVGDINQGMQYINSFKPQFMTAMANEMNIFSIQELHQRRRHDGCSNNSS